MRHTTTLALAALYLALAPACGRGWETPETGTETSDGSTTSEPPTMGSTGGVDSSTTGEGSTSSEPCSGSSTTGHESSTGEDSTTSGTSDGSTGEDSTTGEPCNGCDVCYLDEPSPSPCPEDCYLGAGDILWCGGLSCEYVGPPMNAWVCS